MQELKTDINGGFPLTLDDIRWLVGGLKLAIGQGLEIGGNANYVINGIRETEIAPNVIGNTNGIVVINGEVSIVEEDTVGINISLLPHRYIEPDISFDPTGLKTFEDTSTHDTYQITKYKIKGYATVQTGKIDWADVGYYEEIVSRLIFSQGPDADVSGGLLFLSRFHNVFTVNIAPNDNLNVIVKGEPAGPVIWVKFKGANATDIITVNNTGTIKTPKGLNYTFRSGDWAQFVSDGGSTWELVTRSDSQWITVADSDMVNGWYSGNLLRYRIEGNRIYFSGTLTNNSYTTAGGLDKVFTLPAIYRPSRFMAIAMAAPFLATITASCNVTTGGDVSVSLTPITSAALYFVSMEGVSFPLN